MEVVAKQSNISVTKDASISRYGLADYEIQFTESGKGDRHFSSKNSFRSK